MFSEKYSLYFLDECHEENYEKMLYTNPMAKVSNNYHCAIYIVSLPEIYSRINVKVGQNPYLWVNAVEEVYTGTYNEENDKEYLTCDIKVLREKDGSPDYSDAYYSLPLSYKSIVNLGEELFIGRYKGFGIMDAITEFDDGLFEVFVQALKIQRDEYSYLQSLFRF